MVFGVFFLKFLFSFPILEREFLLSFQNSMGSRCYFPFKIESELLFSFQNSIVICYFPFQTRKRIVVFDMENFSIKKEPFWPTVKSYFNISRRLSIMRFLFIRRRRRISEKESYFYLSLKSELEKLIFSYKSLTLLYMKTAIWK